MATDPTNRRSFIKSTTAASAFAGIIPSRVQAKSSAGKLNIAAIGIGGRGAPVIKRSAGENIVALCDVDFDR